jgi:OOP family OmpA-OmpF porin
MHKTALAALLAALVAAPADAADMYVGVRLGQTKYNITGVTDTPSAFGVFGGYNINPNLAVEAEFMDLGSIDPSSATVMSVSALAFYPGDEPFSLFAKLSYANSEWKTPNQVQHNSSFTHGLGCQYDASQSVSVRFSWDRHMVGNQVAINVDVLSVAGLVRF